MLPLRSQVLRQPNVLIFDGLGQKGRELVGACKVGVGGAAVRVERQTRGLGSKRIVPGRREGCEINVRAILCSGRGLGRRCVKT